MRCAPSCCGGRSSPSARFELPLRIQSLNAAMDVGLLLGVDPSWRDPFRQPVGIHLAHPAFLQEMRVVVSAEQRLSHESRVGRFRRCSRGRISGVAVNVRSVAWISCS